MRLRKSTYPAPSAPCTWNTCFAMSKPIVVACSMDASFGGRSTPSPWHTDAVRGRPPHHPISWQGTAEFGRGSPLPVADRDTSVDPIVGFWRVTYLLPDATGLGFQQWHSDGTEIHNADAPAAAGNICLVAYELSVWNL